MLKMLTKGMGNLWWNHRFATDFQLPIHLPIHLQGKHCRKLKNVFDGVYLETLLMLHSLGDKRLLYGIVSSELPFYVKIAHMHVPLETVILQHP